MKKIIFSILLSLIVISLAVLTACGSGNSSENTKATGTTAPVTTSTAAAVTVSEVSRTSETKTSGKVNWDDMPIYGGMSQIQKGSWSIPADQDEDYSTFVWRYFETGDDAGKIAEFYKNEMPSKGWKNQGWMDIQTSSWGMFVKNNENDAAMVWISSESDTTNIALWRATK